RHLEAMTAFGVPARRATPTTMAGFLFEARSIRANVQFLPAIAGFRWRGGGGWRFRRLWPLGACAVAMIRAIRTCRLHRRRYDLLRLGGLRRLGGPGRRRRERLRGLACFALAGLLLFDHLR